MPSRQRCLESEEFADAVGASVRHSIDRDLGVCIRTAGRPAPRVPGSGFSARGILETTGLTKVFPVYGTEAEAVQACRDPATQQT
jgi:hypothetical protein